MNLTIERAPALSALARAVGIVEKRQTIMILGNVALSADGDTLTVRGTDLDCEVIETIPATITMPGQITVPADKMHDIVRNADVGAQVTMAMEEGDPRMRVRSGRSNFKLPALPATDFPKFRSEGLDDGFDIPAATLADMLSRVVWSIDPTNKTNVTGVVYLATQDLDDGRRELHAVGANKAGVALVRMPAPEGAEIKAMLPPKVVAHIIKMLTDAAGDAHVSSSGALVQVRHLNSTFTAKLFDAPGYFPYMTGIYEEHEVYAKVAQDELVKAIRRVMVMGDGRTGTLHLTFSEGTAAIRTAGDAAGEGVEEISAEYDGPETRIMIQGAHLLSLLAALRGDIVEFGFSPTIDSAAYKTGLLVVRAPCDTGMICNVMQMRA